MKDLDEWSDLINHKRHELTFDDISLIVEDGVFTPNPKITYTPWMIIENLPDLNSKKIADVGTGTGIIAITASKRGAKEVIATDIDDKAIANAKLNVRNNNVENKVTVLKADLLDGIDEKFDYIFANLPMKSDVWGEKGVTVSSITQRFVESVKPKLNNGGEIYIPWGSFAEEERGALENLLKQNGLTFELHKKELLGYTWYLYKVKVI